MSIESQTGRRGRGLVIGVAVAVVAVVAVIAVATPRLIRHTAGTSAQQRPSIGPARVAGQPVPGASGSVAPSVSGSATASASGSSAPSTRPGGAVPVGGGLHFIANVGADIAAITGLGFNLVDTGPSPSTVNALPSGVRALVWLGTLDNHDCANPGYSFATFTAAVDKMTGNPKVYGYFLADEPHPAICPSAAADIRARADYIRAHDPSHKSFIVVLDGSNQCGGGYGCEFAALGPANTHVDLIGLDPYPCNTGNATAGCTYSKIDDWVHNAVKAGVPTSAIVPVYQVFGQSCSASNYYRLPSSAELTTMLAHWAALASHPAFDYAYGWGRQGSACPTLVDANGSGGNPDLQAVVRAHNGR